MINVKEFLLQSNIDSGTYALVTYNNKTEATWFTKYNFGEGDWFLESPCELYKITELQGDINTFCKEYVSELLEEGANVEDYINKYVIPMVVDGVLYEIENFQCSPYLPDYIDEIKFISERECLEYMLKQN